MDSILNDIKQKVGPSADYDHFDVDIVDAINTAFATLTQIGAGPENGFAVTGIDETWDDFTTNKVVKGFVRTYIYNKVRIIFDPPSSSFVLSAMEEMNKELESRISFEVDNQKGGLL